MTHATLHLSPKAGIAAKTAYLSAAYYLRSHFENLIKTDDCAANLIAFAYWDLQYKLKDEELTAHYSKFEIGALLNKIDNAK